MFECEASSGSTQLYMLYHKAEVLFLLKYHNVVSSAWCYYTLKALKTNVLNQLTAVIDGVQHEHTTSRQSDNSFGYFA